jgi:GTP cyclohydrolase I
MEIEAIKTQCNDPDRVNSVDFSERAAKGILIMDLGTQSKIEHHWTEILKLVEPDSFQREGLEDTPKRVAKMYGELFRGYDETQRPEVTVFSNGSDGIVYDELITDEGPFFSQCEHHVAPIIGRYYFGYIPAKKGKILGLSKVARVVDYYAARLQVQERLGQQVIDYLLRKLTVDKKHPPVAMGLILRARHMCKSMRGVKKEGLMTTSCLHGALKKDAIARDEFLKLINFKDI